VAGNAEGRLSTADRDTAESVRKTVAIYKKLRPYMVGDFYPLLPHDESESVWYGYQFDNPGGGKGPSHPAQKMSWEDCVKWCNARSEREGRPVCYRISGNVYRTGPSGGVTCDFVTQGYRLPTDAEWEYAGRGGLTSKRYPWGDTIDRSRANYYGYPSGYAYDLGYTGFDSRYNDRVYPYTSPVGSFAANAYGLYDMAGNVWEWCWDWYPGREGSDRVVRGSSWYMDASTCRVGYRFGGRPIEKCIAVGFRTVLPSGQ